MTQTLSTLSSNSSVYPASSYRTSCSNSKSRKIKQLSSTAKERKEVVSSSIQILIDKANTCINSLVQDPGFFLTIQAQALIKNLKINFSETLVIDFSNPSTTFGQAFSNLIADVATIADHFPSAQIIQSVFGRIPSTLHKFCSL